MATTNAQIIMTECLTRGSDIKFPIWKYTSKTTVDDESGEEMENSHMFMKTAAFFRRSQVESIQDNCIKV